MAQKLAGAQTAQCSPYHLTTWLGGGRGWSCEKGDVGKDRPGWPSGQGWAGWPYGGLESSTGPERPYFAFPRTPGEVETR